MSKNSSKNQRQCYPLDWWVLDRSLAIKWQRKNKKDSAISCALSEELIKDWLLGFLKWIYHFDPALPKLFWFTLAFPTCPTASFLPFILKLRHPINLILKSALQVDHSTTFQAGIVYFKNGYSYKRIRAKSECCTLISLRKAPTPIDWKKVSFSCWSTITLYQSSLSMELTDLTRSQELCVDKHRIHLGQQRFCTESFTYWNHAIRSSYPPLTW